MSTRRVAAATLRAALRGDIRLLATGWWAIRAGRRAQRLLERHGLEEVVLAGAPVVVGRDHERAERAVVAVCDWSGLTCLESALVRREWAKANGEDRRLVL